MYYVCLTETWEEFVELYEYCEAMGITTIHDLEFIKDIRVGRHVVGLYVEIFRQTTHYSYWTKGDSRLEHVVLPKEDFKTFIRMMNL